MATDPKLVAKKRAKTGSAEARRLRRRGVIPGVIYGHDLDPVTIAVPEDMLEPIVHEGQRVVDLELDGNQNKAMFREVQWDTFGARIQHFDLIRIAAGERVTVELEIELRGVAPGTMAGGVMEQPIRALTVECPALQIPDNATININEMEIGDAVHVQDLELPPNVTVVDPPPEATVLQIVEPRPEEELEAEAEEELGPAEPEVIGREEREEKEEPPPEE